jgi:hypothetical protein
LTRIGGRAGVFSHAAALAGLLGRIAVENGITHDADGLTDRDREDKGAEAGPEAPNSVDDGEPTGHEDGDGHAQENS